jgi:hypothetical protein
MLSANLSPFCNICLVRFKKNGSIEFIVLIITQSFYRPRPKRPPKWILINPKLPEENLMRTLTNDDSDCQSANLGDNKK